MDKKQETGDERVILEMTLAQAQAITQALDTYSRLGIGQLQIIEELIMENRIPFSSDIDGLDFDEKLARRDTIRRMLGDIKQLLGFSSGASLSILNPQVEKSVKLSWPVKKEIDQKLAFHHDPNPQFKGVNYDGNNLNMSGLPDEELPRSVIVEKRDAMDEILKSVEPRTEKRSPR